MKKKTGGIARDAIKKMSGVLSLAAYDKEDKLLWEASSHNLIVLSGYQATARVLGGEANMRISKVAVGTNGTTPKESDSFITNAVVTNVQRVEYPRDVTVRFHFEIGHNEAVGMRIQEFGLLTESGTLFSRKVREVIEKSEYFRIKGMWDINICGNETEEAGDYSDDYSDDYF